MILTRRFAMALLVGFAALATASPAFAGNTPQTFTEAAFDAAEAAGKPILIDTFATWCDVCARQKPIIESLMADPKYKDLVTFRVDFDTQKDVMRKFNARVQSTLIAFKGSKEVGRAVGETQPEWIDDLLSKTIEKGTS